MTAPTPIRRQWRTYFFEAADTGPGVAIPYTLLYDSREADNLVQCEVPGCTWVGPATDEAMTEHARAEQAGTVTHQASVMGGYTGPHTPGPDCPCEPERMIKLDDPHGPRPYLEHRGPTEPVHGLAGAQMLHLFNHPEQLEMGGFELTRSLDF